MNEDKMKRALDTLDSLVKRTREGKEFVAELLQHQDSMIIWIVGLASGAVIALPAMYNYVLDPKVTARWVLGIPIAFFVLAVIFGVVVRLLLAELMREGEFITHTKVVGWEALKFKHPESEEGRQQILKEALAILEDTDSDLPMRTKRADKITRYVARLEKLPFLFFAVGVVLAATFAVCPPLKCRALPW